jgi:hypothetical protein
VAGGVVSKLQEALSCAVAAKIAFDACVTCRVPHFGISWQTQSARGRKKLVLSNRQTISVTEGRATSSLDFGSLAIGSNVTLLRLFFYPPQNKTPVDIDEGFCIKPLAVTYSCMA